jgi:GxxExxY protein
MEELREPGVVYDAANYKHTALTKQIIGIFYEVYNALGHGFLEKVYENATALRLRKAGFNVTQQQPIRVFFDGEVIGEYFADLVVNDLIIVELKAAKDLAEEHEAQLLNYLKASEYEVGLLFNFGPRPKFSRKAYDNSNKPNLKG